MGSVGNASTTKVRLWISGNPPFGKSFVTRILSTGYIGRLPKHWFRLISASSNTDRGAKGCPRRSQGGLEGGKAETQRLVQARRQGGQMPAFNEEGDDAGQFLEDVIAIDRALEVLLAAAPAGADPGADHAPDHLQVAIAKGGELFVDLDKRIEQGKGQPEHRLVAVEHDEKRGAQSGRPEGAPAGLEKDVVELAEQVRFVVALGEALLVKEAVAVPERGAALLPPIR